MYNIKVAKAYHTFGPHPHKLLKCISLTKLSLAGEMFVSLSSLTLPRFLSTRKEVFTTSATSASNTSGSCFFSDLVMTLVSRFFVSVDLLSAMTQSITSSILFSISSSSVALDIVHHLLLIRHRYLADYYLTLIFLSNNLPR